MKWIIGAILLVNFFVNISFVHAIELDKWKVYKIVEVSVKERIVFQKKQIEEGAEWNSTIGEVIVEEAAAPGKYKTKKYVIKNLPVVTNDFNAFVYPDKSKVAFVKDKKIYEYDISSGEQHHKGNADHIKMIPDFVEGYLTFALIPDKTKILHKTAKEEYYYTYLRKFDGKQNKIGTVKVIISEEDGGGLNPLNWMEINCQNGILTLTGRFIEAVTFKLK